MRIVYRKFRSRGIPQISAAPQTDPATSRPTAAASRAVHTPTNRMASSRAGGPADPQGGAALPAEQRIGLFAAAVPCVADQGRQRHGRGRQDLRGDQRAQHFRQARNGVEPGDAGEQNGADAAGDQCETPVGAGFGSGQVGRRAGGAAFGPGVGQDDDRKPWRRPPRRTSAIRGRRRSSRAAPPAGRAPGRPERRHGGCPPRPPGRSRRAGRAASRSGRSRRCGSRETSRPRRTCPRRSAPTGPNQASGPSSRSSRRSSPRASVVIVRFPMCVRPAGGPSGPPAAGRFGPDYRLSCPAPTGGKRPAPAGLAAANDGGQARPYAFLKRQPYMMRP